MAELLLQSCMQRRRDTLLAMVVAAGSSVTDGCGFPSWAATLSIDPSSFSSLFHHGLNFSPIWCYGSGSLAISEEMKALVQVEGLAEGSDSVLAQQGNKGGTERGPYNL